MAIGDRCILGQIYGSYVSGLDKIWPMHEISEQKSVSMSHGFIDSSKASDEQLKEAWTNIINDRRHLISNNPCAEIPLDDPSIWKVYIITIGTHIALVTRDKDKYDEWMTAYDAADVIYRTHEREV